MTLQGAKDTLTGQTGDLVYKVLVTALVGIIVTSVVNINSTVQVIRTELALHRSEFVDFRSGYRTWKSLKDATDQILTLDVERLKALHSADDLPAVPDGG